MLWIKIVYFFFKFRSFFSIFRWILFGKNKDTWKNTSNPLANKCPCNRRICSEDAMDAASASASIYIAYLGLGCLALVPVVLGSLFSVQEEASKVLFDGLVVNCVCRKRSTCPPAMPICSPSLDLFFSLAFI